MLLSSDSGKTNRSPLPVKAAKFRVVPGGQVLALLGQFGRRSKASGFRDKADVQRTCSDLPRLTQS